MDGIDEGGVMSMPVMSTDGERARREDAREDGDGESSGAGGGGSTNRKVRDAIWICDLSPVNIIHHLCKQTAAYLSPNGTLLPLPDHAPSTQAPLRPSTTRTNLSSSSSYSIRACRRDTDFSGPRSTST